MNTPFAIDVHIKLNSTESRRSEKRPIVVELLNVNIQIQLNERLLLLITI